VDAVTIATPSGTHEMAALPFLRRGRAVLCEKPLEVTLEKVDSILTTAKENNAVLAGGAPIASRFRCAGHEKGS
jgi:predicted dehydrogenase